MKLPATIVLLLVAAAQAAFGQLLPANVGLIRDINPATTLDLSADSVTRLEESLTDWVPFWTAPESQDAGLWATDGTTAGTRLITDLVQLEYANWDFGLCFSGQTWYFWNTDSDGTALWRTEGTAATTELVARWPPDYSFLTPFWYDSKFCSRRSAGGQILFWLERQLDMSNFRVELWSTDGSTAGTHFIRDLGLDTYYHNALMTFAQHGDKVEFSLQVADNGYGLWESDGTAAGTIEIVGAPPEAPTFWPSYLVSAGERTYFRSWASSILDGQVFGYTDGTPLGTHFFPDLRLQDYYLYTPGFAFIGDRLTFPSGTPEGWAIYSIGSTEAAPSPVKSYAAGSVIQAFSWTEEFTVEGKAVYLASVPTDPSPGAFFETRVVATAGTVETTEEIATFCAGGGENCELLPVGRAGSALVFLERTPAECNLWRTDGTSAGTVEVRTLGAFCTSYLFTPVSAGSRVYFFADGLWASDGTDSGTERIVSPELLNGADQFAVGAAPLANGGLVFALSTVNSGTEPWFSDGTAAGTRRLADLTATAASSFPQQLSAGGGRVVMFANDGEHGPETWVSDGLAGGTIQIADAVEGEAGSAGRALGYLESSWPVLLHDTALPTPRLFLTNGAAGNLLFVEGGEDIGDSWVVGRDRFGDRAVVSNGFRIWSVEEAPARVELLADHLYLHLDFVTTLFRGARGLYFARRDSYAAPGIWITDGTLQGTRLFCGGTEAIYFSHGTEIVEFGSGVAFTASGYALATGPWVCDHEGAAARSLNLAEWEIAQASANLTSVGAHFVFAATDSDGDRELWRSDGTTEGSAQLADIFPAGSSAPDNFFAFDGRVLFTALDASHGRELWITDGTAAGTAMVADMAPGLTSSSPADFQLSHGAVVFTAGTSATGRELWVTAGTPESTRLLSDANPGPASSLPAEITPTAGRIFFRATDSHGAELWAACPGWGVAAELATAVVTEGVGMLAVGVHLTVPAACGGGRFLLEAHSGSATAGVDFTAEPQTVTFIAGTLDVVMAVPVLDDALPEDGETLRLVLRDVLGRIVAEAEALIVDDDGGADADGDGVASLAEAAAPNGGDGNGDGLADAFQPAVASYSLAAPGSGVTIELGSGCSRLTGVEASLAQAYPGDPTQRYPFGLTRFVAPDCAGTTVRILLHGLPASDCTNGAVRKALRRDPATAGVGDWLTVEGALVEPIELGGAPSCALSFPIVDGGLGDLSPQPREIDDPVGLGVPTGVAEIPALAPAGLAFYGALLLLAGGLVLRRSTVRPPAAPSTR